MHRGSLGSTQRGPGAKGKWATLMSFHDQPSITNYSQFVAPLLVPAIGGMLCPIIFGQQSPILVPTGRGYLFPSSCRCFTIRRKDASVSILNTEKPISQSTSVPRISRPGSNGAKLRDGQHSWYEASSMLLRCRRSLRP